MPDIVRDSIIAICVIIALVCFILFVYSLAKKNSLNKMNEDLDKLIEEITKKIEGATSLISSNGLYDYLITTSKLKYYIKVIDNRSNEEICINNAVKWQLRKSFNDSTLRFVPNVEKFMREDLDGKKIFLIYPNARSILKYVNECEMIIVRSDTDIYGTNIITYQELNDNNNLIK